MKVYVYSGELYHHGVKGQKWGVRRYQNPDGSLTDAGRKRQLKQLSRKGKVTISKDTTLMRVSSQNKSDAISGNKLYVTPNEKEAEVYKQQIGSKHLIEQGKAYVQNYVSKNDLVIPSIRTQTKIERGLVNSKDVQKEMIDSLMNKGMSREDATKAVKPINMGMEYLKASPLLLLTPIAPTVLPAAIAIANEPKNTQMRLIRNSIGDKNNKVLNNTFENRLSEQGYNAYRDTNDRRIMNTKNSIVVINPDKNAKLKESREMTREDYGKAYAERMKYYNKNLSKTVSDEDLISDGKKQYDELKKTYVINKYSKDRTERILKKHANELK